MKISALISGDGTTLKNMLDKIAARRVDDQIKLGPFPSWWLSSEGLGIWEQADTMAFFTQPLIQWS